MHKIEHKIKCQNQEKNKSIEKYPQVAEMMEFTVKDVKITI